MSRPFSVHRAHLTMVLSALLALAAAACGGKPVDTTIPLDEARVLNSELSANYVRTRNLLEETTRRVRTIGAFPDNVRVADIDVDLLRHVLEACLTEPAVNAPGTPLDQTPREARAELGPANAPLTRRPPVGRTVACAPQRMLALETYLDVVPAAAREFMVDRVLTVDALRANLKDVLSAQIDDVERVMSASNAELQRLRAISSERRALAQTADLTSEEQRRVEIDYEQISQELDQIESVLRQVATDIPDWRRLRRQLIDEAARNIAELGTRR